MEIHDVVVVYQAYGLLIESLPLGSVSFDMRGGVKLRRVALPMVSEGVFRPDHPHPRDSK